MEYTIKQHVFQRVDSSVRLHVHVRWHGTKEEALECYMCTCEIAYYVHVQLLSSAVNRTIHHELMQLLFDFQIQKPVILVTERFLTKYVICSLLLFSKTSFLKRYRIRSVNDSFVASLA